MFGPANQNFSRTSTSSRVRWPHDCLYSRDPEQKQRAQDKETTQMKHNFMRFSVVMSAIAFFTITSAQAQPSEKLSVTIPFDYYAGGKVLPAGDYIVSDGIATGVMMLRSRTQGQTVLLPTHNVASSRPQVDAKLIFHRYGNRYFLSEIWSEPGSVQGYGLSPSRAEKEQIASVMQTVGLTASR